MVLHEIGVQGGERLPHFERVFLVDTEDDGLCEAVGLGHEAREMSRNGLRSRPQRHDPLEVPRGVFGVGDLASIAIKFTPRRSPSGGVVVRDDAMDAIRGQEAVSDALREAVLIERIAEIVVCVDVVFPPRRRSHPDLGRGLEPIENLPPVAVIPRAAPMAFVNDDEIEEIPRILPVEAGTVLVTRDGLIDREIHVAALDSHATCYLVTGVAKRAEILCHWIVDQDVAIGEKQDLRVPVDAFGIPACRPELPANLEGDGSLARSGTKCEQCPLPTLKRRLNGPVYSDFLIVAKGFGSVWKRGRQQPFGHLVVDNALGAAEPGPKVIRCREIRNRSLHPGRVVELDNLDPVGRIRKPKSKDLGIFLGLLKPLRSVPVAGFGLNDGDREIRVIPEQII